MFLYEYIIKKCLFFYASVFGVFRKYILHTPDYEIIKAEIDYVHSPVTEEEVLDPVWKVDQTYWDDNENTASYIDVTKYAREGTVGDIVVPVSIDQCVLSIWYTFNDKCYKYFTRNLNYRWPPENTGSGMRFSLPIRSAELLDSDMEVVRDVTGKIKKYAGPYSDFFKQEIIPDDMFTYDDYSFLRIVNIIGQEYLVASDGIIRVPW